MRLIFLARLEFVHVTFVNMANLHLLQSPVDFLSNFAYCVIYSLMFVSI